ncbi:MAG: SPOR domain-containing protein [Candidatus Kaelpia aquatica]|nr:SPOR domain-containing protein [Candidatus Kaelpia aquatica]
MENYKENLFSDIDKNVVRRKKRKRLKLITERHIRINEEKICAAVIVFLFLMVGSYVGGYKKGITVSSAKEEADVLLSSITVEDKEEAVENDSTDSSPVVFEPRDNGLDKKRELSGLIFALQVVTYKNMSYAEAERDKLKKMGFPSYIREQGKYKIVFVGDYSEQGKAQNVLVELRKTYKDAFMKGLKGGR